MGNFTSCSLTKRSKSTKIIFTNGEIHKVQQPTKAAELMMESPNTFVVNSKSLTIGARFSALSAEEDLLNGSIYVMLPMSRLNTVVVAADLAFVFIVTKSNAKKIGSVRILPEDIPTPPRLIVEENEELYSPEFKQMVAMSRSKKPLLDTIAEESSFSG